jgi:hypothetical protein
MTACPVCQMKLMSEPRPLSSERREFSCHNCGLFNLSGSAEVVLQKQGFSRNDRAKVAFGIRRTGGGSLVTAEAIEAFISNLALPDAAMLMDNLLLSLSDALEAPGEPTELWASALRASIGALASSGVHWAIEQALSANLVQGIPIESMGGPDEFRLLGATLTLEGWARVAELLRTAKGSRKAFMAMKFGDTLLESVFRDYFKPAIRATGFDLLRLDEEPRAGLIDDRLRLELRTSRFVIADLTHGNNGAYWEAGFAEGAGRPVIYTCRKDVFDDPATRPHFDTNHYLTVIWNPANAAFAADQLKAVVRVTLGSEAVLDD